MGHLRMEAAGGVVGTAKSKTFTLTDVNVDRFAAWAQARFANGASLTPAQALSAWADFVFNRTKDDILNYERSLAAIANEPPDFTAT